MKTELRGVAIITARAFALVAVAALLWRLTIENGGWGWLFAVPAVVASLLAFAICMVGAGLWRNFAVLTLGISGNRPLALLLNALAVLLMSLCAAGLIQLTGVLSAT